MRCVASGQWHIMPYFPGRLLCGPNALSRPLLEESSFLKHHDLEPLPQEAFPLHWFKVFIFDSFSI